MNVAKSVCGIFRRGRNRKTTWWWNKEVTGVNKEKGVCITYGRRKTTKNQKNNSGV